MKKMSLIFLLLCPLSVYATDLDMTKALNCAVDVTGYNDVQKFSISGLKNNKSRDLEVHSTNSGFYRNACEQTGDMVECNWSKSLISSYNVTLNLAQAEISYNYDHEPESIIIDGEIRSSFGRTRTIRCTQSLFYR